jgi:hypothetical protein
LRGIHDDEDGGVRVAMVDAEEGQVRFLGEKIKAMQDKVQSPSTIYYGPLDFTPRFSVS